MDEIGNRLAARFYGLGGVFHLVRHHITMALELLENGKTNKAKEYLKDIDDALTPLNVCGIIFPKVMIDDYVAWIVYMLTKSMESYEVRIADMRRQELHEAILLWAGKEHDGEWDKKLEKYVENEVNKVINKRGD